MSWSNLTANATRLPSRLQGTDQTATLWSLILTSIISILFLLFFFHTNRTRTTPQKPFPFLALPPELRESIYTLLLDRSPSYPPPAPAPNAHPLLAWLLPWRHRILSPSGVMLLTSRQLHAEFTAVLCKQATFNLSFDERHGSDPNIWDKRPASLRSARRCSVYITATPSMMGSFPTNQLSMQGSGLWAFRDRLVDLIHAMEELEELRIHVYARGDRLWNPLWLWHCAGQTFKGVGVAQLRAVTFGLEGWSPGENHLERNRCGQWDWRCAVGHHISADATDLRFIRDFCAALYRRCEECELAARAGRRKD